MAFFCDNFPGLFVSRCPSCCQVSKDWSLQSAYAQRWGHEPATRPERESLHWNKQIEDVNFSWERQEVGGDKLLLVIRLSWNSKYPDSEEILR